MSDATLIQIARLCPDMVPLHCIARAWRLGDAAIRAAMERRATRARCRNVYEARAVRAVLVLGRGPVLERLETLDALCDTRPTLH